MAKVRCAKCGEIFALQQGDIQVCPICACRMKVNRKPQTEFRAKETEPTPPRPSEPERAQETVSPVQTPHNDEYETLRREYMNMMREKLEKNKNGEDGVYLTREEYEALLNNKSVTPAAPVVPTVSTQTVPPKYRNAEPSVSAPVSQPEPPAAPVPDDYTNFNDYNSDSDNYYDDEPKKGKAKTVINWLSFLIALLAGAMSALLLVFDALEGIKGMDMLLPLGEWVMAQSITVAAIFFAPALFAVYALISAIIKGKTSKFILTILFLLSTAAMLLMPFLYGIAGGVPFAFADIPESFGLLTIFDIIAVALNGAACVMMFIAGIATPKKRKLRETDDELL